MEVTCLTSLQLGPSLHLAHRARSPARPTRLLACLLACLPAGKRRAGWLGSEATRATRQPIGLREQQPETRATRDTLPASALGLRSADPGWWRLGLEARNCQAASAKPPGARPPGVQTKVPRSRLRCPPGACDVLGPGGQLRERKLGQGLPGSFPPKAMQATDAPLATLRRLRCCGRPVGGLCHCDVRSAAAPHAVVPSSRGQPNIGIRSVQNHLTEAEVKSKPGGRHNQTGMTGRQGCPPLHAGVTAGDRPHAAGCKHLGRSFSSSEPPT
ncbi:hypothetical protein Purlil1_7647 [Purpureocillium lilacinum]|uniref:Uncharacterized protein n=1 Tax=Purpureocillium lilacinum TaxID=33203 RepID=A0ABR0BV20_PURLI|nr:hypothetical protein Purlil1_7647 [Purpureocillium lilacinum]